VTSIAAADARDKATLETAIRVAVDDIATHAVKFTPTLVSLAPSRSPSWTSFAFRRR